MMEKITAAELKTILDSHKKWVLNDDGGTRADLMGADLRGADLRDAVLTRAVLMGADLRGADLRDADLTRADLTRADLRDAVLTRADLRDADLTRADLTRADLRDADLTRADLRDADLTRADLRGANLMGADLRGAKGLIKIMGVENKNIYWKRFGRGLNNNNYQFRVGINKLRDGELFADDARVFCSFPGFHFGSRSWCAVNYQDRPLEAKIRIPEEAKINEPWATDGKASADMIEILQVFDTKTGEDVTEKYKA